MRLDKNMATSFIVSLFLTSITFGNTAEAGNVKIVNDSDQKLRVDVVSDPGERSYCKKCFDKRTNVCGMHTAEIIVPANAFGGYGHFSMADMENGFLGSGKCSHLSVLKNYEVTFFETTLGTYCEAKEI